MSYRNKLTAKFQQARRTILGQRISRDAILGDENGQVDDTELGYHRARFALSADVNNNATFGPWFRVRAGLSAVYSPVAGRRVRIRIGEEGEWEVVKGNFNDLVQAGQDPRGLNPNSPERAFHYLDELVDLSSRGIGSGLLVQVQGWKYSTDDYEFGVYTGTDASTQVDLTSNRPGTLDMHRYSVVVFNVTQHQAAANPIEVYDGTAVSIFPPTASLTPADIQTAYDLFPPDEIIIPIKAYYLEYGQTRIAGPSKDVDLRTAWNVPRLGSGTVITSPDLTIDIDEPTPGQFEIDVADAAITVPKLASTTLHTANVPPTVNDDSGDGYAIGSMWVDTATDKTYTATDVSVGAAVWVETSGATFSAQMANTIFSGPGVGSPAVPTFRTMVLADIPNTLITRAKLANGTARKYLGFDSAGVAAELDGAIDILVTWGESMAGALLATGYLDPTDNKWYKASIVPLLYAQKRGFVVDLGTSAGAINTQGYVRVFGPLGGFSGLTPGGDVILGTGAGSKTQTIPVFDSVYLSATVLRIVPYGHALDATTIFVDCMTKPMIVRYWRYDDGTGAKYTIHHYEDVRLTRRVAARTVTYSESLTDSHASSNQDVDVQLRGQTLAGGTVTVDNAGASTSFLGDTAGTDQRLAQSFLPAAGRITSVSVRFGATTGTPVGPVTLGIYTGATNPTTLVYSTTFTPTASTDNIVPTLNGPVVAAGVLHWVLLEAPLQAVGTFWTVLRGANPYASGQMKADSTTGASFPGTWTALAAGSDMRCAITSTALVPLSQIAQTHESMVFHRPQRVRLWLKKVGSPTGTLTAYLYTETAGAPDLLLYTSTNTVLASSLTASYAWYDFDFSVDTGSSFANDTFIVLGTTDATSAVNYVAWGADFSPAASLGQAAVEAASTPGTWTAASTGDAVMIFQLFSKTTPVVEEVGGRNAIEIGYNGANQTDITGVRNITGGPLETIYEVLVPSG